MRNCTHYKYIIYTRQMDFKLNTGSCCMGKKGCSKIQNNKLNTYDWLCDVPDAANATDYVEVQFKNTRKGYYLNSSYYVTLSGTHHGVRCPVCGQSSNHVLELP